MGREKSQAPILTSWTAKPPKRMSELMNYTQGTHTDKHQAHFYMNQAEAEVAPARGAPMPQAEQKEDEEDQSQQPDQGGEPREAELQPLPDKWELQKHRASNVE